METHPTDFGVSMRDEVLRHKREDDKGAGMFWTFPNGMPSGVREESRMWVANHGEWVGYFVVESPGYDEDPFDPADFGPIDYGIGETGEKKQREDPFSICNSVIFRSSSFVDNRAGERRPFMGYTLKVPPRWMAP